MSRLELESGTDVLLLETGDALLLEPIDATVAVGVTTSASRKLTLAREAQADIGITPSADRQCVYHRYGWLP